MGLTLRRQDSFDTTRRPPVRFARELAKGQPVSIDTLRYGIRNNRLSFPAQAPVFACQQRSDIQWRLAVLYFVRNWSCWELSRRYEITPSRVRQLLSAWVVRAKAIGYLQDVSPAGVHALTDIR
jgi:hypothetical protein